MIPTRTLNRFILASERSHPDATGELSDLLATIALGVKLISNLVATAGIKGLYGYSGAQNIHGEKTQKLDLEANQILIELLASSGDFGLMLSEENDDVVPTSTLDNARYVVAFDPLDGSSNLGVNISVGTIFTIFKRATSVGPASEKDFYQAGKKAVAAGYAMYGSSTVFVYSCGRGVHEFTLDPDIGEFLLTNEDLKIPRTGKTFSINEGNTLRWEKKVKTFVDKVKGDAKEIGAPYSARYIGSLVADFHRTLHQGGIFLYPGDSKNPRGKLRLLYECIPIAYVAEQAGGRATDGNRPVLDIVPTDIHERCPLIVGSSEELVLFESL